MILDGTVTGDGGRVRSGVFPEKGGRRRRMRREAQGDEARADPGAAWRFRLAISP